MCSKRLAENTGCKKVAKNRHLRTIAQLCRAISSQLRHVSTIGKKHVKQQYVLQVSTQYGELWPTSGWDRFVTLGHPTTFQLVSRLRSVTARHVVVGVSHTLRRWIEGATYVRQGDHHDGHWPTFLVCYNFPLRLHIILSFPCSEKSLSIPGFLCFWPPCDSSLLFSLSS